MSNQPHLFPKRGLPGQMNLFPDTGVPDEMVGYPGKDITKIGELSTGLYFRFTSNPSVVYLYRGSGWYSSPEGYDGGPWHAPQDTAVVIYECLGCGDNECPGCSGAHQNLSCFT